MKHCWKAAASSAPKIRPSWSWLGVPFAKGRKRRRKASFCLPNRCDAYPAIGPAQHRAEGQKQHFVEWIEHLERLARIGQLGKMAGREVEGLADRVTDKCAMCPSGTNSCTEGGKSQP